MRAYLSGIAIVALAACTLAQGQQPPAAPPAKLTTGPMSTGVPGPSWVKDLVIYEIATKSFTSPNGPESGTFASLQTRLPHLRALGINAIWLTGHSLSDPKHFYNIWNQYACVHPFKIDPTLGTPEEFKAMVDACHQAGIRIFLDVVTHGVMKNSPLIKEHPDWFKGESWGMADFNWGARIPGLDKWWIEGWTEMVLRYGVDGFRLDLGHKRFDLWEEIRRRCSEAGHPIAVFPEYGEIYPGANDFRQLHLAVFATTKDSTKHLQIAKDMAATIHQTYFPAPQEFRVELTFADGTVVNTKSGKGVKLLPDGGDVVGQFKDEPDGLADYHMQISGCPDGQIPTTIKVGDGKYLWWLWPVKGVNWVAKPLGPVHDGVLTIAFAKESPRRVPGIYGSVILSCHDLGWEDFPTDQNPYMARGSRSLFGYSTLFAPAIPIFMAGEEFDCDFRPLPTLSPFLEGNRSKKAQGPVANQKLGQGRWLYGNMIDWTQLEQPRHQAMFNDVARMIAIRRTHADVLSAEEIATTPRLASVPVEGDGASALPKPYVRWNDKKAILIAANPGDTSKAMQLMLPISTLNWNCREITVTDLWNDKSAVTVPVTNGNAVIQAEIGADKTPGGGLGVFLCAPR